MTFILEENDMGWLFDYYDVGRDVFLARLTAKSRFGEDYTPVAHRVVGNNLWQAVRKDSTGTVHLMLDMFAKARKGGWGHKSIDEEMGPYQVNCPLTLLAIASEPGDDNARAWREKVREYHAAKKARPKPVVGMVVTSGERRYELLAPCGPRKGWWVKAVDTGVCYRLPVRHLAKALAKMP